MKRTVWLGIVVLLLIGLWGCDDAETLEDGQYYLYYTNRNGDGLVKAAYTPQAAEDAGIASEMLEQLSKNTSEMEKKRSIPDSVSVEGVQIQNGIAEVTFGSTYSQMKRVEEVVCRSSVVLTLMQLGGVKGVEFYIDTEPLKEKNGQAVGVMTENTFTDTGVEIENQYASVNLTLYYANENGDFLKPYPTTGYVKNNSSIERYVIEQLIKGPEAVDGAAERQHQRQYLLCEVFGSLSAAECRLQRRNHNLFDRQFVIGTVLYFRGPDFH